MTDDILQKINDNYENDKAELLKNESSFGNMNYFLKKDEYIKKHLWKTSEQVDYDLIEAMKNKIRG